MEISRDFAMVLKNLIQLTGVKMVYVAKAVGYDISYISKWCSNANIPPLKNADCINDRLSKLFTREVFSQNCTSLLQEMFPDVFSNEPIDHQAVEEGLQKILSDAYNNSKQKTTAKTLGKTDGIQVITGKAKILPALSASLREIIENSDQDIEMISTIDMLQLLKQTDIEDILPYHTKEIHISFSTGLNKKELMDNPDFYIRKIYHFLNIHLNCEITIYDQKGFERYNVLAIKNKIAYLFSLNQDGLMEIATEIKDITLVNTIYKMAAAQLSPKNIIVKPENALNLKKGGYRTKFYSAEEFRFFSAYGFEYLLPSHIINEISKEASIFSGDSHMEHFVKRLQITWEEFFINGKIHFMIPKSNILSYVEHGGLFYLDIPFTMSVEQRQEHVRHIVKSMRANNKIQLTVLDDDGFYYHENYYNLSVYYNKNKAFLKKNGHMLKKGYPQFYVILCNTVIDYLDTFFEHISEEPFCADYDADKAEELINKYEKMLLRMFNLGTTS